QVSYQGAFGPGRNSWASDWTALSEYGIVGGAGGINPPRMVVIPPIPMPDPPPLSILASGATTKIVFSTQTGFSYQLQSAPAVLGTYTNVGTAVPGTGGSVTNTQPLGAGSQFFRVLAY